MKYDTELFAPIEAAVGTALRRHVGSGRTLSVADASDRLGIPAMTIYSYLDGRSRIPATVLFALAALAPELAHEVMEPLGFGLHRAASILYSPWTANRIIVQAAETYSAVLEDGREDHTEVPRTTNALRRLNHYSAGVLYSRARKAA